MKLTDKDKKVLSTFSLYLQSFGSKVGRYRIDVSSDNEVYWDYSYWTGDSTRISIESYDAIDELLKRIFHENEDVMLENFDYEDRGGIYAILNTTDKTLSFTADVVVNSTSYHTTDYTFNEITNENIKEWLSEMEGAYVSGTISYEGSGDSGYIESDIIFNDNTRSDYPGQLEDWMYRELEQYGGWEINEGSQGEFHFNFDEKTIRLSHGENYEEEETHGIPIIYKF